MAMQGKDWVRFHQVLEPAIGGEGATTLVEVLSSVPWGDIATKSDFADLRVEFAGLRGEFADLKGAFADLQSDFAGMERRLIRWVAGIAVTSVAASAGIAAAVASVLAG